MGTDQQLVRYLFENLGTHVRLKPWPGVKQLPMYLQEIYEAFCTEILGNAWLLVIDRGEPGESPAGIRKHIDQLKARFNGEVAYVHSRISSHQRKRLIGQKVPFIIPGNQMYLPTLGLDLREYFKSQRSAPEQFSPATQVVLLHLLLADEENSITPGELAKNYGYSSMTMTRAFNELDGIGEIKQVGRERYFSFNGGKKELWDKTAARMKNPVKRRLYVNKFELIRKKPKAGLSALALYSDLVEPLNPIFACSITSALKLTSNTDRDDSDHLEIEVWHYDPLLFAANHLVDRFSLYLSLRESRDERIESALEEMMRGISW